MRDIPVNASPVRFDIEFHDCSEVPASKRGMCTRSALILNQCDGYHHVFARWHADGKFDGFYEWCGGTDPYEPDTHFCAWAILPNSLSQELRKFARKGPAPQ